MARKNKAAKQAKKAGKQQAKPKNAGQRKQNPMKSQLSECARCWAKALVNPFDADPCCIPTTPPLPSVKVKAFAKGSGLIGSTTGFVAFDPQNAMTGDNGSGGAPDAYPVAFSDNVGANYAGATVASANAVGCGGANCNSPYTATMFSGNTVETRVVAAGLRVKFTGASLTDNGVCIGLSQPEHETLYGGTSASLLAYDGASCVSLPQAREWQEIVWRPADYNDFEYANHADALSYLPTMAFLLTGTTGQSFQWEAYVLFEAVGTSARGKTPSTADPSGFAAASNAASLLPTGHVSKQQSVGFLKTVEAGLRDITGFAQGASGVFQAARGLYAAGSLFV